MTTEARALRIGELSARTNVSVRSIRYYEAQGLLHSKRASNGYRCFDETAVPRVAHIRELFAAGLCSSKIAELLPCIEGTEVTIAPSPHLLDELLDADDRLDRQIRDLQVARSVLQSLIRATRNGSSTDLVTAQRRVDRPASGSRSRNVRPPSV